MCRFQVVIFDSVFIMQIALCCHPIAARAKSVARAGLVAIRSTQYSTVQYQNILFWFGFDAQRMYCPGLLWHCTV